MVARGRITWRGLCLLGGLAACATARGAGAPDAANSPSSVDAELRRNTQELLDAVAPGDVKVWDRLLDSAFIQVDENDGVHDKQQLLADLKPLGPGLIGNLAIDEFRLALHGDVAVVTHEDKEFLDYHGQVIRSRFRNTDTWLRKDGGWRLISQQVLAVLQDPPAIHLDRAIVCSYNGRYEMAADIVATLQCAGDTLVMKRAGRPDRIFLAEARDVFFEPGAPRTRRIFQYDEGGNVSGFVDRREARDITWKRVGPIGL